MHHHRCWSVHARRHVLRSSDNNITADFPSEDWNYGYIAKDPQTTQPYFVKAVKQELQGVKNIWHPTTVEHLELTI
jgi:hypothetical protein